MLDSETVILGSLQVGVSREALADAVGLVARALSSRASVLVLGGIHLRAEGGELSLAATDMEISLRVAISANVGAEGEVVVPGRLLLEIARALPSDDAALAYVPEESVLSITAGGARYRIHTYPAEDFPTCPMSTPLDRYGRSSGRRWSRRSPVWANRRPGTRAGPCSPGSWFGSNPAGW